MRLGLFLILAVVPLVEIALLVQLGKWLGVWATIAIVVGTAVGGTYVLHRQGFAVMNRVMQSMASGRPPVAPVIDGAFLMVSGLLLITPGLLTDLVGLLLLIPPLRHTIAAWSVRKVLRSATIRSATFRADRADAPWPGQGEAKQHPGRHPDDQAYPAGEGPVIDGEFERLDERNLDQRRRAANGDARTPPRDHRRPEEPRH